MAEPTGRPTLVLVTGPGGVGKTTLAHRLARSIGCPVVSRDEIKEGMVAASPGFVPAASDPLTMRTYDVFFAALRLLLGNGVTLVAEAAFQHHLWVGPLDTVRPLADLRIIRCRVSREIRRSRADQRARDVASRAAHDDAGYFDAEASFTPLSLDAPTLDVDTTDGYRPGLGELVAFVTAPTPPPELPR